MYIRIAAMIRSVIIKRISPTIVDQQPKRSLSLIYCSARCKTINGEYGGMDEQLGQQSFFTVAGSEGIVRCSSIDTDRSIEKDIKREDHADRIASSVPKTHVIQINKPPTPQYILIDCSPIEGIKC